MSPSPNEDERPPAFRDIVIIGGGCYGSFYASQLRGARAKGKIAFGKVVNVDRDPRCALARSDFEHPGFELVIADWSGYLRAFLDRPPPGGDEPDDAIVPSPMMPHLMAQWLFDLARERWPDDAISMEPADPPVGTPYDKLAPDGTRYVSFADWLCPIHCVEPLLCPVIRAPRTWEMRERLEGYTAELSGKRAVRGLATFVTSHRAFGVGMFDVADARAARRLLDQDRPGASEIVVATISSCHGAVSILRIDHSPLPSSASSAR